MTGWHKDQNLNSTCEASRIYQNGSSFTLVKDLLDYELYFYIKNVNWNLPEAEGEGQVIFYFSPRNSISFTSRYLVKDQQAIRIPDLHPEKVIRPFSTANKVRFVLGNNAWVEVNLENSPHALRAQAECIKYFENSGLDPKPTGNQ